MSAFELSVSSFNIHAGIDGWGQPFNVAKACATLDTDVMVLVESWIQPDRLSFAQEFAQSGGYACIDAGSAPAVMWQHNASRPLIARDKWGPALWPPRHIQVLSYASKPRSAHSSETLRGLGYEPVRGFWGMTLLCRLPIVEQEVIDLPRLRADRTDRKAIAVEIEVDGCHLRVVGTHLAHLEVGSVFQMRALHRRLGSSEIPTVLCGDMNSWGLPLLTMFPGWRRAVKGATWPAWRPHSQIDHIIYRGPLEVARSEVLTDFGSDHRPVRATFRLGSAKTHPS